MSLGSEAADHSLLHPPPTRSRLKFAVIYPGARMHYAVPALLHRAGMLEAFYTDAVGNAGILKVAERIIPHRVRPKSVRRLLGRRLPKDVPTDMVVSAPFRSIAHAVLGRIPAVRAIAPALSPVPWMRQAILRHDFRGANALYCMSNGDLDVIRKAKRRGMFVAYEQICCPEIGRTLREEQSRYPGLEIQDTAELVESGIRRDLEAWSLSDVVLAPSSYVLDSMIKLGCPRERIAVVPYGLSDDWFDTPVAPKSGRVLFVGSVRLLKGNHYLAEALRILRGRGLTPEFRVVGPCQPYVFTSPLFSGPNYVGQVPRDRIRDEFAQADIFAFPTLSEGFGLAHVEAMACGIPVVTTPHCGSAVREGIDGFIVPIRDATALADRIERILRDRDLRDRMGKQAREQARNYSWAQYSKAMLDAILRAEAFNPQPG
jgi:glycosyltransferase involved in cell wall biosynthesis